MQGTQPGPRRVNRWLLASELVSSLAATGQFDEALALADEAKAHAEEFIAVLAGHEEAVFGKQPARRLGLAAATFYAGRNDDAAHIVRELIYSGTYKSWDSEALKVLENVARLVGVEPPREPPE